MNITRKTSYIIAGLIVLSFFGIGTLFIGFQNESSDSTNPDTSQAQSSEANDSTQVALKETSTPGESGDREQSSTQGESEIGENPEGASTPPGNQAPEEGFALKDFHRSETKNGKLAWEVVGKNARYYPDQKRVDVENCIFSTTENGRNIVLRAGKAKLFLSGPELESAHFSADVTLSYDNEFTIITPEADYQHSKGYVETEAHVKVVGSWYMVEGDGLKAYLDKEQYEILQNVSSVIEPEKQSPKKESA